MFFRSFKIGAPGGLHCDPQQPPNRFLGAIHPPESTNWRKLPLSMRETNLARLPHVKQRGVATPIGTISP